MRIARLRNTLLPVALLAFAFVAAPRAGFAPASASQSASASTASGQRAEPEANDAQKKQEAEQGTEAFKHSPTVVKLGGMLGMRPSVASSVFEWLNFLVLAAAIVYAAAKALPKLLRGRTETIQKNIVEARTATEAANARLAAVEERLAKLDGEIASIRSESEREAGEEEARVKQQIADETARILASAEQEIAAASAQAQRSLRSYAAEIAVDRAARDLTISPDEDRELIQAFAGRLREGSPN